MNSMPDKFVKMQPIHDSDVIEAIGYVEITKRLYVKLHDKEEALLFEGVPRFRHQGILSAPRKDEYYKNFIKSSYLAKPIKEIPGN